jgi:hypothetical protein
LCQRQWLIIQWHWCCLVRSGKSYIVFGKANNSAINLSDIANASDPTGGFVINGEVVTKPSVLVPAAMADNSMALVLSCLPNTTYDLPAFELPLRSDL